MPDQTYSFLAACIRRDEEEIRRLVDAPEWDWPCAIRVASDEVLLPALYAHRRALVGQPDRIIHFLAEVEFANRMRNEVLCEEVQYAASLLNRRGIEPVLLKGAAYLAEGVYADPSTRYVGDLDLLIPEFQMGAAVAALTADGYQEDDSDPFARYRHHHTPLSRAGRPLIELHHSLGLGICARILSASEVIAKSERRAYGNAIARIPCPEHLAVHLVMHSQILHAYTERIWPPLRAMSDLFALQSHYGPALDWILIGERFRRFGHYGTLQLHLRQAAESLGISEFARHSWAPLMRLRWLRRTLLRRFPFLRYADPIYMLSTLMGRRMLILRSLLKTRGGWNQLAAQAVTLRIYSRLWTDLVEGRGR